MSALLPLNDQNERWKQFFYAQKQFIFDRLAYSAFRNSTAMFGFISDSEFLSFGIKNDDYKFVWGKRVSRGKDEHPLDLRFSVTKGELESNISLNCYLSGTLTGIRYTLGVGSPAVRKTANFGQTSLQVDRRPGDDLLHKSALKSSDLKGKKEAK